MVIIGLTFDDIIFLMFTNLSCFAIICYAYYSHTSMLGFIFQSTYLTRKLKTSFVIWQSNKNTSSENAGNFLIASKNLLFSMMDICHKLIILSDIVKYSGHCPPYYHISLKILY